jgi:hypothetical protein
MCAEFGATGGVSTGLLVQMAVGLVWGSHSSQACLVTPKLFGATHVS